jgi:16S rRNA processing protein RimM
VGRIGRAHGVRGEVRVDPLTDVPEVRFAPGSVLYIGKDDGGEPRRATVVSSRPHRESFLVRFDIAENRELARSLTRAHAFVPLEEVHDPGPDAFYEHQLVGLHVVTVDGQSVGRVTSLIETGAADVLVVRPDEAGEGDKLLPMSGNVIAEIDLDGGRITITPLPGLLD